MFACLSLRVSHKEFGLQEFFLKGVTEPDFERKYIHKLPKQAAVHRCEYLSVIVDHAESSAAAGHPSMLSSWKRDSCASYRSFYDQCRSQ